MIKKVLTLGALLAAVTYGKDYSQYKTDKLISADVAKDLIKNEDVVLIDVRPETTFMLSNVKGSYHFWRPDMEPKDKRYGEIGGMRASRDELETELNKMGVNNDTTLVLIGGGLDEYRLWWILDLYGVENVKIVDGGFAALKDAGAPTRMGRGAKEKKGTFEFKNNPDKTNLASIDDVKEALEDRNITILDTRTEEEFHGEKLLKGAAVKGRIPHSEFMEWTEATNGDKTMKTHDELVALFKKHDIHQDTPVIAYCQSAVRSAHTTFVLQELLGYSNVKNYDGSWIEWSHNAEDGHVDLEVSN